MRPFSSLNIIAENLLKKDEQSKQAEREAEEKRRSEDLEHEKRTQKLNEKEVQVINKKIDFLNSEKENLMNCIDESVNPLVISFIGDENVVADKYIHLKNKIEAVQNDRNNIRVNSLSITQIFLAKLSATLFFIFILIRLASENTELIESFVFISIFQNIFGASMMTLYIDLVLQDYPLVIAISYIIAISFKNYDSFYLNTTRTKLFFTFGFFIAGLFVSSMLFSY